MTVADLAADLTARRLAVFPCKPDKKPRTPRGFLDATNDATAARELFRRYPGPLIGVATGEASGVDILDLDGRHGAAAWWIEHRARIPQTRTHRTRSGGLHLLFQHRDGVRNTESKIGPGVDTRGAGGYFIYWPADGLPVLNFAPPAVWPDWLYEAITLKPPAPAHTKPVSSGPITAPTRLIEAMLTTALARLEAAPVGQRHYQLRAAAGGISDHDAAAALLSAAHRTGAENMRNAEKTVAWGLETGRMTPFNFENA